MPIDPQKKKAMDALFKNTTGEKPQVVVSGGLPPIQERITQLSGKNKKTFNQTIREGFQDIGQDISQLPKDIKSSSQKRAENIGEIQKSFQRGEINPVRGTLQIAGQLAGAGADAIGNLFKAGVKTVLPQVAEEKLKEVANNLGEEIAKRPEVQSAVNWYSNLDENQKKDIDAVGGIVSLVSEFVGVGTTKRGLSLAKEGLETATKNTADIASKVAKRVSTKTKGFGEGITTITETAKEVGKEFSPSNFADRQFVRAFKLTPPDVSDVETVIGGNVSEWAVANNLIGKNADETIQNITKFKLDNYNTVRDAVGAVEETFSYNDIPELENLVDDLILKTESLKSNKYKNLNTGLKTIAEKLNNGEASLSDVQFAKSTFDDIESIFKRSNVNELKEGMAFQDLGASRSDVQKFIEDRVSEKFPDINIRELNRNVSASKTLVDDIIKRSQKFDTASSASLGDYFVFGLGQQMTPGVGVATLGLKKIAESTPIRMILSKWLAKKGNIKPTDLKKIQKEIADEIGSQLDLPIKQSNTVEK